MKKTKYPQLTNIERRRLYNINFRKRKKFDPEYQQELTIYRRKRRKIEYQKMKTTQPNKFKQYIKKHEKFTAKSRKVNISRMMLNSARSRAKKFKLEFSITETDFNLPVICPIFSIPLVYDNTKTQSNSPSLDRIDPTKGYIPGNVHVISWRANRIKSNATKEELKMLAEYFNIV